ncbi:MAG: hypothetical protein AAF591_23420 [Verrucomicrobiota bacterium]
MPEDGSKVWVAVDVHGAGGLKNEGRGPGLAKLLEPEPVIVIVPSFTTGYQGGDGKWAAQMLENFEAVQEAHAVHDKIFVHGHSGGGQFAHRFAFEEPDSVVGVSAHSSGSWACDGGHGEIRTSAKGIPFTISCGEEDTDYSVKGYPHTRIEWYKVFAEEMEKKGFVFAGQTWPGVGHGVSSRLYGPQLKECFLLATRGEVPESAFWKGDVAALAATARGEHGGPSEGVGGVVPGVSSLSEADLAAVRAANEQIAAGRAPDVAATLRFLVKYPASTWCEDEAFGALKAHCEEVAGEYMAEQGAVLSGERLEQFRAATEGLALPADGDA